MTNISSFLSRSWQKVNEGHPLAGYFVLLLLSVPLSLGLGNAALILFAIVSVWHLLKFKTLHFRVTLLLPVLLFLLMAASLAWSIDVLRTLKAIPREIYLLAIPLCCMAFPGLDANTKKKVLQKYGYGMAVLSVFYLLGATVKYVQTHDSGAFFYHGLVREEVNAIHVSIYMAVAFFGLLAKESKTAIDWLCKAVLTLVIVLLSSKNVIVVFGILVAVFFAFYSAVPVKRKLAAFGVLMLIGILPLLFFPNITDRFEIEMETASNDATANKASAGVYNVSVRQAWNQERFNQNDFFPGTAFRVYQIRVFTEILGEDQKFLGGYGLNASQKRIAQKANEHGVFKGDGIRKGYHGKNFHNQYIQNLSDLGVFGFALLAAMLFLTLKNGLKSKDFTHISFAVLLISLFLTESFLMRQRGVMFFTTMYCLLNSDMVAKAAKKE